MFLKWLMTGRQGGSGTDGGLTSTSGKVKAPCVQPRLRQSIPDALQVESDATLEAIAKRFEIAGGHIMNVVRYAAMKAAQRKEPILRSSDLETGLHQELQKAGKLLH